MHCSHSDLSIVESYLQSDLDAVTHWLCSSQVCLNVVKYNSMLIGSHQRIANKTLNVSVGSTPLAQVNSVHYLGVTIDLTLSWNLHVSNVVSRTRHRITSILRFGSLPPEILCLLYTDFVQPAFDHCDVIWYPTTTKFTSMTERVHSKFIKKLPLSCVSITLTERRRYHMAIQVFKSVNNCSPSYLQNVFCMWQVIVDTTLIAYLFSELLQTLVKVYWGTLYAIVWHSELQRLPHCLRSSICILITIIADVYLYCVYLCCVILYAVCILYAVHRTSLKISSGWVYSLLKYHNHNYNTIVTSSAKSGLIAFPNSQLWLIISPQFFKLSPLYFITKWC